MFLKVPERKIVYSPEPEDGRAYTGRLDRIDTKSARL